MMPLSDHIPVKHRLRSGFDRLAACTGLLRWHEIRMRRGLTILTYHRVLPQEQCSDYPLPSLVIPVEIFRLQMQWLAAHCRVLPVREAMAELATGDPFAKPLAAITFDDGYFDNFTLAAPVLEECGLRGTFFVTTGFVEEGKIQWFDRAADAWQRLSNIDRIALIAQIQQKQSQDLKGRRGLDIQMWMNGLKRLEPAARVEFLQRAEHRAEGMINSGQYKPMTVQQAVELYRRGHELGSHTLTHPLLPQLNDDELYREVTNSANQLGKWTGGDITGFCYPNGDFDLRVEHAVTKAGYGYSCTIEEGINRPGVCPTRLSRLPITRQRTMLGHAHDTLGFRAELSLARLLWRKMYSKYEKRAEAK
jgi:peptidoglycan/xylan/chitin deacetylase (PgdA/CDA1 family)